MNIYISTDLDEEEVEMEAALRITHPSEGGYHYEILGIRVNWGWIDLGDFGVHAEKVGGEIEQRFSDRYYDAIHEYWEEKWKG